MKENQTQRTIFVVIKVIMKENQTEKTRFIIIQLIKVRESEWDKYKVLVIVPQKIYVRFPLKY